MVLSLIKAETKIFSIYYIQGVKEKRVAPKFAGQQNT